MAAGKALMLVGNGKIQVASYLCIGCLIVDSSGSMSSFGDAPCKQTNMFLDGLRKDENADVTAVSVVTFADTWQVAIPPILISEAPCFSGYKASGNTLLYDTVFNSLGSLMILADQRGGHGGSTDVVLTVLTDGQDTHSHPKTLKQLEALSRDARRRGWTLRVFGFGVDGSEIAKMMGFEDIGSYQPAHAEPQHNVSGGYTVRHDDEGLTNSVMFSLRDLTERSQLGRTGKSKPS